jgi:hypothetical protein
MAYRAGRLQIGQSSRSLRAGCRFSTFLPHNEHLLTQVGLELSSTVMHPSGCLVKEEGRGQDRGGDALGWRNSGSGDHRIASNWQET